MADYNFKNDLSLGEIGEQTVIGYLINNGGKLITKNNDNKYDAIIEYNGNKITYEIKTDVFCAPNFDTGNIFIEIECRGKESGLSVTEAKWFVTYFLYLNEIWFIETDKLKKILIENDFPISEQNGDLNSNTKGYLIKRKDIQENFKIKTL
jgi:hypothetical protein